MGIWREGRRGNVDQGCVTFATKRKVGVTV
jgi:hypothetical protein